VTPVSKCESVTRGTPRDIPTMACFSRPLKVGAAFRYKVLLSYLTGDRKSSFSFRTSYLLYSVLDSRSLKMFCFPYPRDTDVEPIRIPLIARTQYSVTGNPDFSSLFEKVLDAKKKKAESDRPDGQESTNSSPRHSLASDIQSSLFFGVASKVLGRNIEHEEFAVTDPVRSHLSINLRIPEWY